MKLIRENVTELLNNYCNGNYNRFAREMGVDPSHIFRFLNTGVGGGTKLISGVVKFCKDKQLKFEDYIDLYK